MDLKHLMAYYIDYQLENSEYVLGNDARYRSCSEADKDAFRAVLTICSQLEHDDRFSDVLASFRKFGIHKESFLVVLDQLLIGELNWARVLSVVTLTGALARQCRDSEEEYKIDLIHDWAGSFVDTKLEPWIDSNNGMEGLRQYFTPPKVHKNQWERKLLAAGACGAVAVVGFFVASRA